MRGILATGLAIALATPAVAGAQEVEVTANVGWTSDYYYRGVPQKTSSANAGLDLSLAGLSLGTWAADVGDGAEVDVFGGYTLSVGDASLSVGGTGYFYTGDFDNTYLEANIVAGFRALEAEFSFGSYDAEPEALSYSVLRLTGSHRGGFATVGTFLNFFEAEDVTPIFVEVGYGFEAGGLDVTVSWLWSDENLSLLGRADNTLILGISRSFSVPTL